MFVYNKKFIKLIRETLNLTQQEIGNLIGIPRETFQSYESGRSQGSIFFHQRMITLFGIDLCQPPSMHKIVFVDTTKISSKAFKYLSGLELYEFPEERIAMKSKPVTKKRLRELEKRIQLLEVEKETLTRMLAESAIR